MTTPTPPESPPPTPAAEAPAAAAESVASAAPSPAPTKTPKLPFALQPGEKTVIVARRHWAFLTWNLAKHAVFYGLVPIIIIILIANWTVGLDGTTGTVVLILCGIWFLIWAAAAALDWYRYNHDMWVVTDQRVMDSSKPTPISHRLSSADLVDVADISVEKNGIFATVFNYGNVRLQTAGAQSNFTLSGVPKPNETLATIDHLRDTAKQRLRGL